MEQWQEEYITKNKDKLMKITRCNIELLTHLESCGVLSHSDIDSLKAVGNKGALDQVSMLYEILQTRIRGYEKLTKSIFECSQTGALKILLEGFEENKIERPFDVCGINLDIDKFMQLSATFMGKPCKIRDICGEIPKSKLQNILQSTLSVSHYYKLFHAEGNDPKLNILKNNIPEPLDFYVPRSLSARLVLDPKIFREKTNDVFVFTNIERHQLTLLVRPNKTATSDDIYNAADFRFILLSSEDDLDELRNTFADSNLHLIKYMPATKQCILERTWGNARFIRRFMNSQITVTENEFMALSQDNGHNGICICDTPGMGKSVLLANLARNIASENNQKICIFISLAKLVHKNFMDFVREMEENNKSEDSILKSMILDHISSSSLETQILNEILFMENKQVELFFDGFDEILDSEVSAGIYILQGFTTEFPNSRVYVTSRPHMQHILEGTLGVIGYKILPFDKTNQINFLVNYWKGEIKNSDEEKLHNFAQECLDTLENNINSTDIDIAGVPIQCRILAEVLKNDAKRSLRSSSKSEVTRILSSIFDMYSEFMKMRFAREQIPEVRNELKYCHVITAVDLIFPQMTNSCKSLLRISTFPIVETLPLLNIGILEGQQNDNLNIFQFVHRTFAEFLIAQFFANLLLNKGNYEIEDSISYSTVTNFFHKTLLTATEKYVDLDSLSLHSPPMGYGDTKSINMCVSYPTINYFLNGHAKHIIKLYNPNLFNSLCTKFEKRNVYRFMIYCLKNNQSNTFEIMVKSICIFHGKKLRFFRKYFTVRERAARLLYIAISFCETNTIEKCFHLYQKGFKCDLRLLTDFPLFENVFPLQLAVMRGHYGIVEFLIEQCKFPYKNRNLLLHCIESRINFKCDDTSDRIQIIKYLVSKDRSLLDLEGYIRISGRKIWKISTIEIKPCLFNSRDSHVEILKCLINEGANVLVVDNECNTFLKVKAVCLNGENLHELVCFLSKHPDATKLFRAVNIYQCTLLHQLMACYSLMSQTLELVLRISNIDIHSQNQDQETPLFAAIRKRQSEDVFKFLLEKGSDISKTNCTGGNILDVMKRHANDVSVLFFLSSGKYDDLCSHRHGNTLLHLAAMKTSPVQFDDCVRLLINRNNLEIFRTKNQFGFTPLQLAIQNMNVLEDTLELIITHTGVDINCEDKLGETLLFTAIKYHGRYKHNTELVMKIIHFGADLKKKNWKGETVLHLAVRCRRKDIVLYLIKLGANVMEKNKSGETPLDIAEKRICKPRSNHYIDEFKDIFDVLEKCQTS